MISIGKNVLTLSVIIALTIVACFFGYLGNWNIAAVAVGALAGWVGGNYNGRQYIPLPEDEE